MLHRFLAILPRSALATTLIVALGGPSPLPGADRGGPVAKPARPVQAPLERAAAPPGGADQRLPAGEEAGRAAETAGDAAGGLAAATLAENEGRERYRQGELAAAEGLLRRA